ncbi:phage major capsid protein [Microbacterium sp. MTN4-26]|uniref:phage major capsid protein n=1 Tax=unclassified Microbacterium TaxID=2609290 RepID=UPI0036F4451B
MDSEIRALQNRLKEIESEHTDIHTSAGTRALDSGEQARWDDLETEAIEVRKLLREAEERQGRADRVAESRARWNSLDVGQRKPRSAGEVARMGSLETRDEARRLVDSARHLEAYQGDHVMALLEGGESTRNVDRDYIARLTVMTESPEYRSAFQQVMTNPHPVLSAPEAAALRSAEEFRRAHETRGMVEGTPTAGGYGVPVLIDPTIILTGQQSANPFLGISRVVTITTNQWKGVSSQGVTWSWDSETDEVSDDSPTLAQPSVPVHSARGFIPYSIELEQDYPEFANEMAGLLSEGYAELTAAAFATGSGVGQPTGIFTALDANTNVEVVVTTDGEFGKADISKVWSALPDRAKPNATWLMSEDAKEHVRTFDNDEYSGRTVTLTEAQFRIRERDVVASGYAPEFAATTGAANILAVGDFRKYLIAQRAGMRIELVPHIFGANGRPTGQRGWFAWARVGADSIDDSAFRLLQNQ